MAIRILYVITKANWGGAQHYVYDLIQHAREYGYEPSLAYGDGGLLAERVKSIGVNTYQVKHLMRDISPFNETGAVIELAKILRELKPAVVHLNSSKAGYIGIRAAQRAGVPRPRVIFTAHGWAFTESRSKWTRWIFRKLQRTTVLLADATIAVSGAVKSIAAQNGIPVERMTVIPLGISEPGFLSREEARAALIEKDPLLATRAQALWVGTIAELHKNKGIDIGIDAWRGLPAETPKKVWVIIGEGDEHEHLIRRAAMTKDVHLLGFIPDAARYLKAFDLFVLPSRTEALAYVILEAGMAEVPVIGSNVGGIPEAMGYPAGGLFTGGDVKGFRDMLYAYLKDAVSLRLTGKALRKHVQGKFPLKNMLDQTFALYSR